MKKILLPLLAVLLILSCKKKDEYVEKIFEGHVELNTQFQVDSFGNLGYTNVTGTVVIGNYEYPNTSITNLDALTELRSASHMIINYNNALTNVNGLDHLTTLDAQLIIRENPLLTNLDGLECVTNIGAILEISKNESLTQIDALANFEGWDEGGNIRIWGNQNLKNIDGLTGLEKGGWVNIYSNPSLENLEGLKNVEEALYFYISNNQNLTSLDGLRRIKKLAYSLDITNNSGLSDFCGLKKLMKNDPPESEDYNVYGNASNPSMDDIVNGDCD